MLGEVGQQQQRARIEVAGDRHQRGIGLAPEVTARSLRGQAVVGKRRIEPAAGINRRPSCCGAFNGFVHAHPFLFATERPYLGEHICDGGVCGRRRGLRLGGRSLANTIALVDDDRNILTSVSMALEAEGFAVRCYADGAEALKGLHGAAGRRRRARHQDAAHGRHGAAGAAAPADPTSGDLPHLERRRGRRAPGPAHGRRRLHQEAVLAAPADRAHPGAAAPRRAGARARGRPRRAGDRARPADPRSRPASLHLAGRAGRADRHRIPDPASRWRSVRATSRTATS